MTSSIAHQPSGVAPFSQHRTISNPGFGEIRYDNTLTSLMPCLIKYADGLIKAKTAELSTRASSVSTDTIIAQGIRLTPEAFIRGFLVLQPGSIISSTTPLFSFSEFSRAFETVLNKKPHTGDSFLVRVGNNTGANISIQGTKGDTILIEDGKAKTILVRFDSADYEFISIGVTSL